MYPLYLIDLLAKYLIAGAYCIGIAFCAAGAVVVVKAVLPVGSNLTARGFVDIIKSVDLSTLDIKLVIKSTVDDVHTAVRAECHNAVGISGVSRGNLAVADNDAVKSTVVSVFGASRIHREEHPEDVVV